MKNSNGPGIYVRNKTIKILEKNWGEFLFNHSIGTLHKIQRNRMKKINLTLKIKFYMIKKHNKVKR